MKSSRLRSIMNHANVSKAHTARKSKSMSSIRAVSNTGSKIDVHLPNERSRGDGENVLTLITEIVIFGERISKFLGMTGKQFSMINFATVDRRESFTSQRLNAERNFVRR